MKFIYQSIIPLILLVRGIVRRPIKATTLALDWKTLFIELEDFVHDPNDFANDSDEFFDFANNSKKIQMKLSEKSSESLTKSFVPWFMIMTHEQSVRVFSLCVFSNLYLTTVLLNSFSWSNQWMNEVSCEPRKLLTLRAITNITSLLTYKSHVADEKRITKILKIFHSCIDILHTINILSSSAKEEIVKQYLNLSKMLARNFAAIPVEHLVTNDAFLSSLAPWFMETDP